MTKDLPQSKLGVPFFGSMALLIAAVCASCFGLWMLWTVIFHPVPSESARAMEAAALGILIHEANQSFRPSEALKERLERGPGYFLYEPTSRVHEAAAFARSGIGDDRIPLHVGIERLMEFQAADVWKWRFRQGMLFALPGLAIGIGAGWLGLRILRRLKLAGTVFAGEGQAVAQGAAETSTSPDS
jgi:hypothetical protein